jgi:hypothetical protein
VPGTRGALAGTEVVNKSAEGGGAGLARRGTYSLCLDVDDDYIAILFGVDPLQSLRSCHRAKFVGRVSKIASDQLRHRHPRLAQRRIQRRGVALVRFLKSNCHDRPPCPDPPRARPCAPGACARLSSSQSAHLRPSDSSILRSTCASCASGPAAPTAPASASPSRGLRQSPRKLLVALPRVAPHNRTHRRVRLQRRRIEAIRWPFSSPRSASTPSTQPNTSRCVSRAINRRVREIVEWSGVYSSSAIPTKRRSASESAKRPAIPCSLSMPSKYPISSDRK